MSVCCGSPWACQERNATSAEILTNEAIIESVTASVDRSLKYMAKQQRPDGHHEDETIPTRWIISQRYQSSGATAAVSRTTTYYYFHYYAVQASYQAGREYWANWHPRVRELFLDKQDADGSRDVPGGSEGANVVGPNKIYWTSMATLVLEIYMHFLPAYQR